ncbi:unnamed protein product [Mytilus edulis]|uniref:PiggyBac transposable element-derived protein domain-containing protein n=1 Tax=Mytilus edulis TaxID=6550 RepID=A0A8S3VJF0_MYTED|nr:unnamed protein product [Mytilus edulis]
MKFRQKGCLVASAWKDKKVVNVLSTIHDNSTSEVQRLVNTDGTLSRQNFVCPKMVSDYTSNMGGVNRATNISSITVTIIKLSNGMKKLDDIDTQRDRYFDTLNLKYIECEAGKCLDIQSLAKKKESARLQVVNKTGGGPPPEDTLKSWEKM